MNEIIQVLQEPLPRVSIDALSTSDKPRVLVMGGGGIAPGVVTATVTIVQRLLER
jgi:uridylate kinase